MICSNDLRPPLGPRAALIGQRCVGVNSQHIETTHATAQFNIAADIGNSSRLFTGLGIGIAHSHSHK
jgi:hypothetical protein